MTLLKLSTLMFLCLCLPSCATQNKYNGEVKEAVLREGMTIHFKNKNGEGSISYVTPNERTFTFDGHSQTIKMIPRPERFLGQLGIYNLQKRGLAARNESLLQKPNDISILKKKRLLNWSKAAR